MTMKKIAPMALLPAAIGATLGTGNAVGSPVEKVVMLLRDLKTKTENDGKVEQKVYDKFKCWCDATIIRKEGAIADGRAALQQLGEKIEKEKKNIAVLTQEITETESTIAKTKDERATAITIRSKAHGEWVAETDESKQAIAALVKAIEILVDGTAPSFLQGEVSKEHTAVQMALQVLPQRAKVDRGQVALLSSALEGKYAPQSMTIQGILKDMFDTLAKSVESATRDEAIAQRNHDLLVFDLDKQLEALQALLKSKNEAKAESETNLADASQSYDTTEAELNADTEFLKSTKESCNAKAVEWKTRKELRTDELEGIDKAIEILTSDDARTLFASSIKAGTEKSFLQVASESSAVVSGADRILKNAVQRTHSTRLAGLALRLKEAKAGHFDEVIKAIDKMIVTVSNENKADIDKRDQCKEEYGKQESTISNLAWLVRKNVAKLDQLERKRETRKEEKETTIAKREQTEAYLDTITQQRNKDHAAFLHTQDEDEKTVALLTQAKNALMAYYQDHGIELGPIQGSVKGALVQEPVFERSADDAPDAIFSDKAKRKGQTKGILTLMQYLLEDAKNEIINDATAEEKSVANFNEEKKAAETLIAELKTATTELASQIAGISAAMNNEQNIKADNEKEKTDEEAYLAKITPDCDWILANFEKRAAARTAEMDGLRGAKDALVGSTD